MKKGGKGLRTTFLSEDNDTLDIDYYYPDGYEKGIDLAAMVWFYGGGWLKGDINAMKGFIEPFRRAGYICICPQYRTFETHGTTAFEAAEDAASATKFIVENAEKYGVNTKRLIGCGHSAGGHVVAIIECNPDYGVMGTYTVLALSCPVLDTSPNGYGYNRIGAGYEKISPLLTLQKIPPTIICHGEADNVACYQNAWDFTVKALKAGCICQLDSFAEETHGFHKYKRSNQIRNEKIFAFLKALRLDLPVGKED